MKTCNAENIFTTILVLFYDALNKVFRNKFIGLYNTVLPFVQLFLSVSPVFAQGWLLRFDQLLCLNGATWKSQYPFVSTTPNSDGRPRRASFKNICILIQVCNIDNSFPLNRMNTISGLAYCLNWCRTGKNIWNNTLRPRQNWRHFADDILKSIFLNENVWIPIEISLKFVPKGPIDNIPALV